MLIFLPTLEVHANNQKEIEEFCSTKRDYNSCARDYKGLPELEAVPDIKGNKPIQIQVVPYKLERIETKSR